VKILLLKLWVRTRKTMSEHEGGGNFKEKKNASKRTKKEGFVTKAYEYGKGPYLKGW